MIFGEERLLQVLFFFFRSFFIFSDNFEFAKKTRSFMRERVKCDPFSFTFDEKLENIVVVDAPVAKCVVWYSSSFHFRGTYSGVLRAPCLIFERRTRYG